MQCVIKEGPACRFVGFTSYRNATGFFSCKFEHFKSLTPMDQRKATGRNERAINHSRLPK